MNRTVFTKNVDVVKEKGTIPYWKIANKLNISEQTIRYWLRRELDPNKKELVLKAIRLIKQEKEELLEAK